MRKRLEKAGIGPDFLPPMDDGSEPINLLADKIDRGLQTLYYAGGRNRFAMTMLAAAAYEDLVPVVTLPDNKPVRDEFLRRATRASEFVERVQRAVVEYPMSRRDGVIIELVLNNTKRRHENGEPLPELFTPQYDKLEAKRLSGKPVGLSEPPTAGRGEDETGRPDESGEPVPLPAPDDGKWFIKMLRLEPPGMGSDGEREPLYDLQRWILWHLAVIGQPTECEVLARCDLIVKACSRVMDPTAPPIDVNNPRILELTRYAIALLERRCFVFRLTEYGGGQWDRFAVHRRLQRNILERLGAPFIEFPEVDQFTMTMFATQPNDLPKLSREAHEQLRNTVSCLSGYPEALQLSENYRKTEDQPALRRQMLRAALGILRSVYSVATLGRLDHEHQAMQMRELSPESRIERGYFEEHRLLVRWLIHQAVQLQQSARTEKAIEYPFYQEEITWLLNECGVLSLAQGRLTDAVALFELAQSAAKEIEIEETGAIRTRIGLNQAVMFIERGRFKAARQRLSTILATEGEHDVIPLIASGYLGLIEHLTGRLDQARHYYRIALDGPNYEKPGSPRAGLIKLGQSRSASIFYRHYGDLLRAQGSMKEAELAINQAVNLAREGGHADVAHGAQLSKIQWLLVQQGQSDLRSIFSQLQEVYQYARMAGIPRLICEAEVLRARALRDVGDLKGASEAALKSLEIATLHDLRLWQANAANAIAEVSELRKMRSVSVPLNDAALEIATDADYFNALSRAQQLRAHILGGQSEVVGR
jgi:tetratricopeptide (TPR) repeat protein